MRAFLGLLMIAVVSGDTEVNVTAFKNENVLLPCSCENIGSNGYFKWQNEEKSLLGQFGPTETTQPYYTDRVVTSFINDSSNCSILLKNITEDDNGTYICCFHNPTYQRNTVNLWVYGPKPYQQNFTQSDGVKVFTCEVKTRDNQTGLLWTSELLTDSSMYKISNKSTLTDGIFHVTSTLRINLTETNSSSEIKCDVNYSASSPLTGPIIGGTPASPTKGVTLPEVLLLTEMVLLAGLCLIVFLRNRQKRLNNYKDIEEEMMAEGEPQQLN